MDPQGFFTPPADPPVPIPNNAPEAPDLQLGPNDVTTADDLPARRSTRIPAAQAAKAAGKPTRLEKTLKEVGESRARVEEAKADKKRKKLEDRCEGDASDRERRRQLTAHVRKH